MKVKDWIEDQLILEEMRQRIAELETADAQRQRAEEALGKAREELEQRVQERTAELVSASESLQAEVTERKGAEAEAEARAKELATSEEKYRRLLGDINDGYLVVQDEKVIMANERAAEIYGVPLDEYIGSPLGASFPADVQEQIRERFRRRIAGEAEPERYELTTATGIAVEVNAKLIDYEGRPAVAAVVRDITHRKRTEEALRERTRATSYI